MTNQIIKAIENNGLMTFVLFTDEIGYWYWEVSKAIVDDYNGSNDEFVNDECNADFGYSESGFDSVREVLANLDEHIMVAYLDRIENTDDINELESIIEESDKYGYFGIGDRAIDKINELKNH